MGKLCRSLVLEREIRARWTSGLIKQVNATIFASICNYDLYLIAVTGETVGILRAEEEADDEIHDFVVDPNLRFCVTSHASQLLKLWVLSDDEWEVAAQWKCPGKFPAYVQIDTECQKLACATAGQACYFFQLSNQTQICKYDIPKGQPSAMTFDASNHLWIGDHLGHLTVIDLSQKKARVIKDDDSHHKRVTSIVAMPPYVVTGGLDEVALLWNEDGDKMGDCAIFYSIHSMIADPANQNCVYVATPDGVKRVNMTNPRIAKISHRVVNQLFMFDKLYSFDDDKVMRTVKSSEHNAIPMSMFEVADVAIDTTRNVIAAASSSNTNIVQVFTETDAFQLAGHTALPICLDAANGLLISGARDSTARIWSIDEMKCLTTLMGHSRDVVAVAFVPKSDTVVTASLDNTLKLWRPTTEPETNSALCSVNAHDKEINALAVSIDGSLVATVSQDKTAKIWQIADDMLKLVGVLSGHRRGVTAVAFSPVDKIVATGSADNQVKIWSVDDGSCISTFTEYTSTITKLVFISEGLQIATSDSNGTIKVVRTKTGAPDFTNEEAHDGTIWGMCLDAVNKQLVSGGRDGRVCVWDDNTLEREEQERAEKDEATEAEQELKNALRNGEYLAALKLAFKLRMPSKLRMVVRQISELGLPTLEEYFSELDDIEDYKQWMDYIAKWCTNSRWADDATAVLTSLTKVKSLSFFITNKRAFESKIDAIIPYLERHMGRLDRLNIQSYAIDDVLDSISAE